MSKFLSLLLLLLFFRVLLAVTPALLFSYNMQGAAEILVTDLANVEAQVTADVQFVMIRLT